MAHGDTHNCYVCGKQYTYCEHCSIVKPDYNADRFCSHEHQDIFATLSKHGCNLMTADDALKELSAYNLDKITLTESILSHIEKIESEAGVKVEKTVIVEEPDIIEETTVQYDKKNKKKW